MAGSALLERERTKEEQNEVREREKAEALKHAEQKAEFSRLLYSDAKAWSDAPVRESERPSTTNSSAAELVKTEHKPLFEDYAYVDGQLVYTEAAMRAQDAVEVPAAPVYTPEATPLSPETESDEDAMPTRRTMQSLNQASETATAHRTAHRVALSSRLKIVLAAVVAGVVLAFVLICVNTGILNSLNKKNADLKNRLQEEQQTYERLQEESDSFSDPDNELVREWAERNGMTK